MNFEAFHKNFPKLQQNSIEERRAKAEADAAFRKEKFLLKYPSVDWEALQLQKIDIRTNDFCIHYKDSLNNQIYSWNFRTREWLQQNDQASLAYLF